MLCDIRTEPYCCRLFHACADTFDAGSINEDGINTSASQSDHYDTSGHSMHIEDEEEVLEFTKSFVFMVRERTGYEVVLVRNIPELMIAFCRLNLCDCFPCRALFSSAAVLSLKSLKILSVQMHERGTGNIRYFSTHAWRPRY